MPINKVLKSDTFISIMFEDKSVILIKFGTRFREIRKSKNYSQAQLANELNVEISQISRIERGLLNTSVYFLYSVSEVLQVEPDRFFDF